MPTNRRTKIRIATHEITIIRFRSGEESADAPACAERVIPSEEILSEIPEPKLGDDSNEKKTRVASESIKPRA